MSNARSSALGIIKEATYGAGGTPTLFLFIQNERWRGNMAYSPRGGARKTIGRSAPEAQAYTARGGGLVEVDPDLGALLFLLMGKDTVAQVGATTAYDHVFTLDNLKSFVAQSDAGGIHVKNWLGNVMSDFTINMAQDAPVTIDFNCITKNDANTTVTTPSFSTKKRFNFKDAAAADVLIGGSANANLIDATIKCNRNILPARHAGDGLFISGYNEGEVAVSGTMKLEFPADTDYRTLLWGGATKTQPDPNPATSSLKVKFTSVELIEAGYPYLFTFECPKIVIPEASVNFARTTEALIIDCTFEAYESAIGVKDDLKLTLRNNITIAFS